MPAAGSAVRTASPLPLIRANPPRLSEMAAQIAALEQSGVFTNNGELVRRFEAEATRRLFGGVGGCVTVANATLGLMLALRESAEAAGVSAAARPLALMPSFTFAATAHAALWAGLQPLLCDIDPMDWAASARAEERQLKRHGRRIAAVVPYATFGNSIDLERYAWLSRRHGVDVVVDAASSLGSRDAAGRGFGTGSRLPVVFSMHATKTFATGEGGLIYSADLRRVARLRRMAHFGFGDDRAAVMPGLNAKMTELMALLALAKLDGIGDVVAHRSMLVARYCRSLPGFGIQAPLGQAQAQQFMPVLLPAGLGARRPAIMAALAARGIGTGKYFSPHLAEQPYFRATCLHGRLPVTRDVAGRIMALPLADMMTVAEVDIVCAALLDACGLGEAAPAARHTGSAHTGSAHPDLMQPAAAQLELAATA